MTSKFCSCSGANENCFRCGGLGTYELAAGPNPPPRPKKKNPPNTSRQPVGQFLREKPKPANVNEVKCGRCIFRGSPEEVKTHREKFHRREFAGIFFPEFSRFTRVPCPQCGQKIRASKLKRHLRKAHTARAEVTGSTTKRSPIFVSCPKCSCRVLQPNLEKHLRRVHDIGWAAYAAGTDRTGRKLAGSGLPQRPKKSVTLARSDHEASASPRYETEDLRDANRLMGFPARENGRYGSHPLHDRFDDESFS